MLLQLISSNRYISDVSGCIEKTKPFDMLAKRVVFKEKGTWVDDYRTALAVHPVTFDPLIRA